MYRLATLRKNHECSTRCSFDVCVTDLSWETREESAGIMNGPGNNDAHTVIGVISFRDDRSSVDIACDFALRYPARFQSGHDATYRVQYSRYEPQFRDFLVQAFANYFSERQ